MVLRNSSNSVMSASSLTVTCGIITQLRDRFWPEIFLMRLKGCTSISPNLLKSTFGHGNKSKPPPNEAPAVAAGTLPDCIKPFTNDLMSSLVTRPLEPEPLTLTKSTPNSRANLRVDGPAWALEKPASSMAAVDCKMVLDAATGGEDSFAATGAAVAAGAGAAAA